MSKHPEIPVGPYCYGADNKQCPHWAVRDDREHQNNGYCSFLERGDWEGDGNLLLCENSKVCGINDPELIDFSQLKLQDIRSAK